MEFRTPRALNSTLTSQSIGKNESRAKGVDDKRTRLTSGRIARCAPTLRWIPYLD